MAKKKLYGIFAFVFTALCALGFAFGFTACSNDDDTDPLIGTWEGNVEFDIIMMGANMGAATADTTIIVDENAFSLSVKNVDLGAFASLIGGGLLFEDEDYVAIEDATWVNDGNNEYTATAEITGSVTEIPIVLIKEKKTSYISLTADIALSISGMNVTASFNDARVEKTSNNTTKPWTTTEGEEESNTPDSAVTQVIFLPESSDEQYTTSGSAVFKNSDDLKIEMSDDGLTYTVSGTASKMGVAEAAWFATDDVEEGAPYVVIKIHVAIGETITYGNEGKSYTNTEGSADFDGEYMFIVIALKTADESTTGQTSTFTITSASDTTGTTYTVSFAEVDLNAEGTNAE